MVLKFYHIVIVVFILNSCSYHAGSFGVGKKWKFDCSIIELKSSLASLVNDKNCEKNELDKELLKGYDFLDLSIICIGNKRVMVSLIMENLNDTDNSVPSIISVRAINSNNEWKPVQDYDEIFVKNIDSLFREEIIERMDVYPRLIE